MQGSENADYVYSAEPVRSPFRYARSVWRLIRNDPAKSTADAGVVEIGFARSKLGRRFARWGQVIETLQADPRTAPALAARHVFGPIRLDELKAQPADSLGRVFAAHCCARDLDPNLVYVPPEGDVGWMLNHLYQTHDIWHVVTGWGNDLAGEVGLGGFYCGQLRSPTFFGYMLSLIIFNVITRRADLDEVLAAFSSGFRGGRAAAPMFGADWDELLTLPLAEVRQRFGIDQSEIVGEGIRAAA